MSDSNTSSSSMNYYLFIDEQNHQYGQPGQILKKGLNLADNYTVPDKITLKYGAGGFYIKEAQDILTHLVRTRYLCIVTLPLEIVEDFRMTKLPDGRFRVNGLEITEIHDMHKVETFELLKKVGANLRSNEDYPLKWALAQGLIDIGKFLLNEGAELTSMKITSKIAAQKGYLDVVKLIRTKQSGYDDNVDIDTALIGGYLPTVLYLESRGAQIVDVNESLVWACRNGNSDIVTHLLTKEHDINYRSGEPLKVAAMYGHLEVIKLLINNGVDSKIDTEVALKQAEINGHTNVIDVLTGIQAN